MNIINGFSIDQILILPSVLMAIDGFINASSMLFIDHRPSMAINS
jgi:hypothetical protein